MLRDRQLGAPVPASLDVGLELRIAVDFGVVILAVGVEGGRVGADVDRVRPVEVCGTQWYRRGISYSDVQEGGRRQYAVFRGRVYYRVSACLVLALHPNGSWKLPRRVQSPA
jgi:hypothetical protein